MTQFSQHQQITNKTDIYIYITKLNQYITKEITECDIQHTISTYLLVSIITANVEW